MILNPKLLKPKTLFENDSGSNANITLNDNVENYEYIEIFYRNNDNFYSSRKFYKPSGQKLVLDSYYVSSSSIVFKMNYITISGTSVTRNQFIEANKNNITQNDTSRNVYITRVFGYK